ncbi:MAG: hypothetical protein NVSMB17_04550 [Candidatus Dormibacteria bacterium]
MSNEAGRPGDPPRPAAGVDGDGSFGAIVENALDAVVLMGSDGVIQAWNAQAERTFGWSREEAIGRTVAEVIVPAKYREAHSDGLERYLETGDTQVLGQIVQLSAVRRDGTEIPVEIAISPAGTSGQGPFVAFIRDISERVAAQGAIEEQRLEQANALHHRRAVEAAQARQHAQRMVELERLKTEFMKLASHELRGPLTVIRGYLSMLVDGSIPDAPSTYSVLTAKANQMNLLLNQMLEVARLEEGRLQLALRRADLRDLVAEAFEIVRPLAPPEVSLELDPGEVPAEAMVDPNRVRTVVASLLENAVKYSPGGGRIICRLEVQGDVAVVSVADSGIGIAPEDMPRLFTRFGRIVTPQNSHIDGSGLGLYLCREITLMHGGDVAAESSPLLGTTISVSLPLLASIEAAAEQGQVVGLPAGAGGYDLVRAIPGEMIRLGATMQRIGRQAEGIDDAADALVRHLYRYLVDRRTGRRGCALVRFYTTQSYALLDAEKAAFVRATLNDPDPPPSMRCLSLVGSAGDEPEWNDPAASRGHRVIPLPSEAALEQLPMVAQLLRQLGTDVGQLLSPDPSLMLDVSPKTYNVFFVPEATGSIHVPAQADFVRRYGIESVIGFGGLLSSGELFAIIMFTNVPVPARSAGMFRLVAQAVKQAIEPFGRGLAHP